MGLKMPLLPTVEIEEKRPKSSSKPENPKDFYMKLPRLLPSNEIEETTFENDRFQKIKFIALILAFVILIVFLHLNRAGI